MRMRKEALSSRAGLTPCPSWPITQAQGQGKAARCKKSPAWELVTSSHGGSYLHQAALPWPCAWVMGHEGQGVAASLEARAALRIRIAQPGGEESLNVAAAAAICLHASGAGH